MELLSIGIFILVVIGVASYFGWQQGQSKLHGYVPVIEPPPVEGLPTRPPDLTGSESRLL
jgi:hypothetical protein